MVFDKRSSKIDVIMKKENTLINRILKFTGVGITCTIVDYALYSLFAVVIFGGNPNLYWLATMISGTVATFAAYMLHSHITWKERDPGKYGIVKFFAWNILLVIAIRPVLTFIFGILTGLYQFAFMITDGIGLPFSYEFVESTGIFVMMIAVTMVLNYLFYNRIIFGAVKTDENQREKVDVDGVRKAGEEKQRKQKGQRDSGKKRK